MKNPLENLYPNIFFIKEERICYIIINNEKYKYDKKNIEEIRKKIEDIYKWNFYKMNRKEAEKIANSLIDENSNYILEENTNNKIPNIEVYPYQSKKKINILELPYEYSLNIKKAKPYLLIRKENITLLIEITKEYILENPDKYYFLLSDITEEERLSYLNYHQKIEYNNIYNIPNKSKTKQKGKVLRRKR